MVNAASASPGTPDRAPLAGLPHGPLPQPSFRASRPLPPIGPQFGPVARRWDPALGGYAAKTCPIAVAHKTAWTPADPTSPDVEDRRVAGIEFERDVVAYLVSVLGDRCRVISSRPEKVTSPEGRTRWVSAAVATRHAMEDGVEVIIRGRLPPTPRARRQSAPDLLVRVGFDERDRARYMPADIKRHRTLKPLASATSSRRSRTKPPTVARLTTPTVREPLDGFSDSTGHWFEDSMQIAHYVRHLEDLRRGPVDGSHVGAILGTCSGTEAREDLVFVFYDLDERTTATWSSQGKASRSIMEVYDYEYRIRQEFAAAALVSAPLPGRPFQNNDGKQCELRSACRS